MEKNTIDSFIELPGKTSPSDFDGHTEFNSLTPEQKLMWLSQCAKFVNESKNNPE